MSVAGPHLLCFGASEQAQQVRRRMEREATYSYLAITVPEDAAANCLYVNGTLIHRAIEEIPESFKVRKRYYRRGIIRTLSYVNNSLACELSQTYKDYALMLSVQILP